MSAAKGYDHSTEFAAAPPLFLVALNAFVFAPFALYVGRPREFESGYLDISVLHATGFVVFLIVALAITQTLMRLRAHWRPRVVAMLFGMGLLTWLQSNFMVWDYGDLDGREIEWSGFTWQGYVDAAVWIVVLAACLLRPSFWARQSFVGSIALIVLQLMNVMFQTYSSEEEIWSRQSESMTAGIVTDHFDYSTTRNVVHVLFDSFQTDVFLELVEEEELESEFGGFTLFLENSAVAFSTTFAIPAIFSGDVYDGSVPFVDYFDRSVRTGISDHLYGLGYSVRLTPVISLRASRSTSYVKTPSHYEEGGEAGADHESLFLLDVAFFRQAPHFFRKLIYDDNNWFLSDLISDSPNEKSFHQKAFFRDYVRRLNPAREEPAYHFIHLWPPHPPYVTLADGSSAGEPLPITRGNFKNEAKYVLREFVAFLERLKSLGLYESSMIVLQGDHGSQFEPIFDGVAKPGLPKRMPALLVIKPPGAVGPLQFSRAPTTVADVPATIQATLGLEHDFPGVSAFELQPGTPRERLYVAYLDDGEDEFLTRRMIVEGSIYDADRWSMKDKVEVAREPRRELEWGSPITFGVAGTAAPFLGYGWSAPGSSHRWNNGKEASFNFLIEPTDADLTLEMRLRPFLVAGKVEQQRIRISVGDRSIAELNLTEPGVQSVRVSIPNKAFEGSELPVVLGLPDAESQRRINAGGDWRTLAIAMGSLSLVPDEAPKQVGWGSRIEFDFAGTAAPYLGYGWSKAESSHRWSSGKEASLDLFVEPTDADLELELKLWPFLVPGKVDQQRIQISVGDHSLGELRLTQPGVQSVRVSIPNEVVKSRYLTVVLGLPDAESPQRIEAGVDARMLAIAMLSMSLATK